MFSACAGDGGDPQAQPLSDFQEAPSSDLLLARACSEGQTETCALTLGEHDGVLSCYEGTRSCSGGVFGACENGVAFTLPLSAVNRGALSPSASDGQGADLHTLATASAECANNPCNRYCREFNELPDAGLTADPDTSATPPPSWPQGNLSDYPAESAAMGLREPCQVAGDCQFNTSCIDPGFGTCEHSVCSTGDALAPGCNRCASAVCAANADCCGTQPACAHDPCDGSGFVLDENCDPCVQAVCAKFPECCDTSWNSACVDHIATECAPLGQSCGCPAGAVAVGGQCVYADGRRRNLNDATLACTDLGSNWNIIKVDDDTENSAALTVLRNSGLTGAWLGGSDNGADGWIWRQIGDVFFQNDAGGGSLQGAYTYENWGTGEPTLGQVGRGIVMNTSGEWSDGNLADPLLFICEGPPTFLTPRGRTFAWSQACMDLVPSQCGIECPSSVPFGVGACVERSPSQLDARCQKFDLALGATCEDSGKPVIPVCNHGQKEAPLGLRLSFLPASELRKAAPDLTLAGDCVLNEVIPPGRCVSVSDCPPVPPDSALVVNPRDAGNENTDECRLDDNWSVYQPVACGDPICESGTLRMRQVQNADCTVALRNPLGIDATQAEVEIRPDPPQPHCAPGEELWGNSCYFFSRDALTWDAAETQCQRRGNGWELVALNSPEENRHVRSLTDSNFELQIGLNDKDAEGSHEWSNESCRKYDNWLPGAPNDPFGGGEQCGRMLAGSDLWDDTDCDNLVHPYACEGPVQDAQGACRSDELMGPDGSCYFVDPSLVDYTAATSACTGRGSGWNLVQIESLRVNEFVTGLLDCAPAWIAGVNPALTGAVVAVGDPYINAIGNWQGATSGELFASLCQGPPDIVSARQLNNVKDAASCTGGDEFFFDGGPVAPETLRLCPATCSATPPESLLDVSIPCAPPSTPVKETTHVVRYSADCEDNGVVWDFLYYDAVTPADSRIEFDIRTAPTLDELIAGTTESTRVAEAHAIPTDTQRCEVNPLKNCPVDIFAKLGTPAYQYKELELRIKMVPGSNGEGPLLRDWSVRFSCPPSQ